MDGEERPGHRRASAVRSGRQSGRICRNRGAGAEVLVGPWAGMVLPSVQGAEAHRPDDEAAAVSGTRAAGEGKAEMSGRLIVFEGTDSPFISSFYDNSICCYSFSKSLSLPGERIGYVAVNPKCKDAKLIVLMCGQISRFTGHNCPPSMIQLGVAEVIDKTADLSIYEKNKNILYKELTNMGYECVEPGGTFYMFPKTPIADANAFCRMTASKLDLILVPGDSFMCPGHMRLAYCTTTEMVERALPLFEKAMKLAKEME